MEDVSPSNTNLFVCAIQAILETIVPKEVSYFCKQYITDKTKIFFQCPVSLKTPLKLIIVILYVIAKQFYIS